MMLEENLSRSKPYTIRPDLITNEEIARFEGQDTDENGSMNYTELLNNLNLSRGESDIEIKSELENVNTEPNSRETRVPGIPERRSKRLTKTTPIVRFNNPIILPEYRKQQRRNNAEGRRYTAGGSGNN